MSCVRWNVEAFLVTGGFWLFVLDGESEAGTVPGEWRPGQLHVEDEARNGRAQCRFRQDWLHHLQSLCQCLRFQGPHHQFEGALSSKVRVRVSWLWILSSFFPLSLSLFFKGLRLIVCDWFVLFGIGVLGNGHCGSWKGFSPRCRPALSPKMRLMKVFLHHFYVAYLWETNQGFQIWCSFGYSLLMNGVEVNI